MTNPVPKTQRVSIADLKEAACLLRDETRVPTDNTLYDQGVRNLVAKWLDKEIARRKQRLGQNAAPRK